MRRANLVMPAVRAGHQVATASWLATLILMAVMTLLFVRTRVAMILQLVIMILVWSAEMIPVIIQVLFGICPRIIPPLVQSRPFTHEMEPRLDMSWR